MLTDKTDIGLDTRPRTTTLPPGTAPRRDLAGRPLEASSAHATTATTADAATRTRGPPGRATMTRTAMIIPDGRAFPTTTWIDRRPALRTTVTTGATTTAMTASVTAPDNETAMAGTDTTIGNAMDTLISANETAAAPRRGTAEMVETIEVAWIGS